MMPAESEYQPQQAILGWFEAEHYPTEQREIADACRQLAEHMAATLPHNEETYIGLRKLLEAKDCFVRASIAEVGLHRWVSQTRWSRGSITDVP